MYGAMPYTLWLGALLGGCFFCSRMCVTVCVVDASGDAERRAAHPVRIPVRDALVLDRQAGRHQHPSTLQGVAG